MRTSTLILAAALTWSAPLAAQAPAGTAAEIAAIEQAWGQAFLKEDLAYIESIVAPEFKLMGEKDGVADFTPRAEWIANTRGFDFHEYEVRTVDVVGTGNTAVATVEGRWKIGRKGLPGTRESRFIVSDTFVRRGGTWQVIYRHATTVQPTTPAAATASERGR